MVKCTFCDAELDPRATTTYQKITGWDHPRSGGGTNALALAKRLEEFACYLCIDRQKHGVSLEQQSLV